MRQKQAAEAKLMAAQNRQREGLRKEQEKLRAAEAAEKKANEERLANQPPPREHINKEQTTRPEPDPGERPRDTSRFRNT
jgi:hypothetical protein